MVITDGVAQLDLPSQWRSGTACNEIRVVTGGIKEQNGKVRVSGVLQGCEASQDMARFEESKESRDSRTWKGAMLWAKHL
jgi:hypothetical protein